MKQQATPIKCSPPFVTTRSSKDSNSYSVTNQVSISFHRKNTNNLVRKHFQEQFLDRSRDKLSADTTAQGLSCPITTDEFEYALRRLNNGRTAGPDDIPGELLKYAASDIAPRLTTLLNRGFERGEPLSLGHGILLCLQNSNKPRGECSSLRPIVLLNTIRKAVSLIVLHRITPAVDTFLSSHQSGFRKSRSTADAVWAHKWLCARVQQYREIVQVLGLTSRARSTPSTPSTARNCSKSSKNSYKMMKSGSSVCCFRIQRSRSALAATSSTRLTATQVRHREKIFKTLR